jgi:nicotinate-nucleotide adenylyltransferase
MRIGILGGSFDPVHLAHLIMAEQCREQARLDQVLFIPAARPPHKLAKTLAPFHARQEMLELALAGYPAFQISLVEKDRPGPSYTLLTLEQLQRDRPGAALFLLLGSDCLPDLPGWHQPEAIARLAELLIVARPESASTTPPAYFRWQRIDCPLLEISSTDLRKRVAQGRSIRYFVPRAVECYIEQHGLYRP